MLKHPSIGIKVHSSLQKARLWTICAVHKLHSILRNQGLIPATREYPHSHTWVHSHIQRHRCRLNDSPRNHGFQSHGCTVRPVMCTSGQWPGRLGIRGECRYRCWAVFGLTILSEGEKPSGMADIPSPRWMSWYRYNQGRRPLSIPQSNQSK